MSARSFPPTRAEGSARLGRFLPHAASAYASGRNTDEGPDSHASVSLLSPYLRHRLITEQEVVAAVLARHNFVAAEKYVQEVMWRTYWKGWLEMRPAVWRRFLKERETARESLPNARLITAAENGVTGIEGFDDWARELCETGYLHNHARMWFASIWIFTLRLPWTLGADFFLRHLIDADAASNTLSWRWVAGLQTVGKTYLATAENITRFTGGRFAPKGLATQAVALTEPPIELPKTLPKTGLVAREKPSLLLVTHEDMHPETVIAPDTQIRQAVIATDDNLLWSEASNRFVRGARTDTRSRIEAQYSYPAHLAATINAPTLIAVAQDAGALQIVTPYAPVGPVADALAQISPILADEGIALVQVRRDWDTHFWPHAQKGFFPFKEKIPKTLSLFGIP
jgi:deoxyribodipyrimidine photo-lyase